MHIQLLKYETGTMIYKEIPSSFSCKRTSKISSRIIADSFSHDRIFEIDQYIESILSTKGSTSDDTLNPCYTHKPTIYLQNMKNPEQKPIYSISNAA